MGETALARQLKKLAVPQTSLLSKGKLRKSLLFDFRDAAILDRTTVFAYGICGLEKLEEIFPLFGKFKENLFSNNYAEMERSVQTANVNKKLDERIMEFLQMISPYFLNLAASHALEWLVYRYNIHHYNTDALMAAALPHFNTTQFVRVVQLLSLEDEKSRWAWLKPVQKHDQPLEYPVILNHFISDGGFRTFVCNLAPRILKVYKSNVFSAIPIISFSMQTMYNAIDKSAVLNDSWIVFYLPYILKGIKSNVSKYAAASYLILTNIMTKVNLDDKLVIALLIKVFQSVDEDLLPNAFDLLLVVYQQQPIKVINTRLLYLLLSKPLFLKHLMRLSEFDAECLFKALIKRSVPTLLDRQITKADALKTKKLYKFCRNILNNVQLSDKTVSLFLNLILKNFLKTRKGKANKQHLIKAAKILIKELELKYPDCFDKAVTKYFCKIDDKSSFQIRKLINASVCSVKNSILPDSQTTLILGLNHANENIRKLSVQFLMQKIRGDRLQDSDFIKNTLHSKLFDDSPSVVVEILKFPETLCQYVERTDVLLGLSKILLKTSGKHSPWHRVQMAVIDIICNYFTDDEFALEVFVALLPFIFPLKKSAEEGYLKVINSKYGVKLSKDQRIGLNYSTVYAVNKYVSSLTTTQKSLFLAFLAKKCVETSSNSLYVIYVLAIGHAIVSEENINEVSIWTEQLLHFLKRLLSQQHLVFEKFTGDESEEDFIKSMSNSLSKEQFPIAVIYSISYNIVRFIKLDFHSKNLESWMQVDNSPHCVSFKTLVCLFNFCIEQINCGNPLLSEAFQVIFSKFMCSQFQTTRHLFYFLSFMWLDVSEKVSSAIQVTSLCIAKTFCQNIHNFSWFFENYVLCFNLLKAVSSSVEVVRHSALGLLSSLLQCSKNCSSPMNYLCKEVQKHEEEIIIDSKQCYRKINNWLKSGDDIIKEKKTITPNLNVSEDIKARCAMLETCKKLLLDDITPSSVKFEILLYLNQIESLHILSSYLPVINKFMKLFKESNDLPDSLSLDIVEMLLKKFTPKTALFLNEECSNTLFKCLTFKQDDLKDRSVQLLALNILSKKFFIAIPSIAVQKKLLETLLELCITSAPHINVIVKKVLNKLSTFAYLILMDFPGDEAVSSKVATLKEIKKSRIETTSEVSDSFTSGTWKKLSLLLEIIQNKSELQNRDIIIPKLFAILNKTLNVESQSSVEYLRQLILSSIFNCCQQLGSGGLDETQFQVELIVQCIRSSRNPKTHQQSLLLLNLAATLFPEYVLNNVMSIFTFMGSNLIRQDDSYSFKVISQTIETIVPSLLEASSHKKDSDTVQVVAEVIRVFVDSLTDIPRHRQMPLFSKLITTLDSSRFLWIPLGQICDQYATLFHDMLSEDIKDWKLSPTLEFSINLHKQFPPIVQIDTCINLLNFLTHLPDKKEEFVQTSKSCKEPFNVANHTNQQLQIYKHNVLSYINIWLSSHAFISQVSELDSTAQSNLEKKYVSLLETALIYLQHQKNLPQEKIVKSEYSIIPLLINLVCHVNSLLPNNLFIKVLRTLLKHSEPAIQNKAVEILNSKLEQQRHQLSKEENHKYLLKLVKPLLKLIKSYDSSGFNKNVSISQQTALYSLHLLTGIIGSSYPSKFYKVLIVTVQTLNTSQNQELTVTALLCLAQLCCSLNVEVLPQLNVFMPAIIDLLTDNKILDMNDGIVLGVITALQSLIENLGTFLSSYMQSLVSGICLLSAKYQEAGKKNVHEKFLILQTLLAKDIPLRILLTALEDSYSSLQIICPNAVIPLSQILNEKFDTCTFEDIKACLPQLEKLCIALLSFRYMQSDAAKLTFETISLIESSIITALKTFVMKLSVNIFEKFFKKVYQWVSNVEEEEEQKWKVYTFYNLTSQLSYCLKNLFVVVAKCFLRNAAFVLQSNNSSKDNLEQDDTSISSKLLANVLDTLNNCFTYDDGHLLDKENFELLMQPLIDQLENYSSVNPDVFQERVKKHLSSCIAHFMAAVSDNSLWKKSNYQILLKTRHDSPAVRFATIQVIREVVSVMGDNYLVLLPESIPFLAEVMEDESSEVEQECQSVILEMEKILGEPIRKYF